MNVDKLSDGIEFKNSKLYNICYGIKDYISRYLNNPSENFKLFSLYKSKKFKDFYMMCCGKSRNDLPVFITLEKVLPKHQYKMPKIYFDKYGTIVIDSSYVHYYNVLEDLTEVEDCKYEY